MQRRPIELLAPAANADIAIEAIRHGADAVYMGGPSHGARKAAFNSLEDIRRVVEYAHLFRAKVYVTVNTIIYDSELSGVEKMIGDLYRVGVDALIVQDMGILRMKLPPIQLHASTQCDIRTPEKALFLQEAGFSQLVLARELTLHEIKSITNAVDVPVECFVHGALCVSYSGRCHASQAIKSRSANRGECAQICRLPYTLRDAGGKVLAVNSHLLSLKDFNATDCIPELLEAGVSSFKIEGRLKDVDYVKNITAWYRKEIDKEIDKNPDKYIRASFGISELSFIPQPYKSFNRGFTSYFLKSRRPANIASLGTPKSLGETISDIHQLNNGDGISYFDNEGNYTGVTVNGIKGDRIIGNRPFILPKGAIIHRTSDIKWQQTLNKDTAERKLGLYVRLDKSGITGELETGVKVRIPLDFTPEIASREMDFKTIFDKFGNTPFYLHSLDSSELKGMFIPASVLSGKRRELTKALITASETTYLFPERRVENKEAKYFSDFLDYRDNVSNSLAEEFYKSHGIRKIEKALETFPTARIKPGTRVMTTRHCILRELGKCLKDTETGKKIKMPLSMESGNIRFCLEFDCSQCQMHVNTR